MSDYRAYLAALGLSSPMALEGFLEAAPDAIVVVDGSGNIVIVNRSSRVALASYRLIKLHAKVTIHKPQAAHAITP